MGRCSLGLFRLVWSRPCSSFRLSRTAADEATRSLSRRNTAPRLRHAAETGSPSPARFGAALDEFDLARPSRGLRLHVVGTDEPCPAHSRRRRRVLASRGGRRGHADRGWPECAVGGRGGGGQWSGLSWPISWVIEIFGAPSSSPYAMRGKPC